MRKNGKQSSEYVNQEELSTLFGWIKEMLDQKLEMKSNFEPDEYAILSELKDNGIDKNGIRILIELDKKYGKRAKQVVASFLKDSLESDWVKIGKKEAREGNEIADFIRVLWKPLLEIGFEYQYKSKDNIVEFTVTRCPIHEIAEQTGLHEWLYQISCMSDFYTGPSFSPDIGFVRTKTLMLGDDYCNHTFFSKKATTNEIQLGSCGLFCGNCPNYQKTVSAEPIHFSKEDSYEPCLGCRSDIKTTHCSDCDISLCSHSKGVQVCLECEEFPCEVMINFIEDTRYPYHRYVEANMKELHEVGLSKWVSSQSAKYSCGECGTRLNFFQTRCHQCDRLLNL